MKMLNRFIPCAVLSTALGLLGMSACGQRDDLEGAPQSEGAIATEEQSLMTIGADAADNDNDSKNCNSSISPLLAAGREIFRYDTFGDEDFWGGELKLHKAIAGAANGGTGAGLSPKMALANGLKVDIDKLPYSLRCDLKDNEVNLDDPATTLALLKLNSVIGVAGFFDDNSGQLESVGITCALCHSTVDKSFSAPGIPPGAIGKRLDGWPNRDLNVGAIIAMAPTVEPFANLLGVSEDAVRAVFLSWGPGKFDAQLALDGKAFRPDGKTAATLIPPAFGLAGVNLHTSTGWGSVPYWNAFVAIIEMHGKGRFFDPRLSDAAQFPVAAAAGFDDIQISPEEDRVTSKLPALQLYQLSIAAPKPPPGSYDAVAAKAGEALFNGKAKCGSCHTPPLTMEPGWSLHTGAEIGIDDFQANRSPTLRYRTAPLRGLFAHQKGGFYHDGRFSTLLEVVNHYNAVLSLGLSGGEKNKLVQYLKSL